MVRWNASSWLALCALSVSWAFADAPSAWDGRLQLAPVESPAVAEWALFADKSLLDELDLPDAKLDPTKRQRTEPSHSATRRARKKSRGPSGTVVALFGAKKLDPDDWVSDEHTALGVDVVFDQPRSRTGWVFGYLSTEGSGKAAGVKEETETQEFLFGIRDTFQIKSLGPIKAGKLGIRSINGYLNGGLALVSLDADIKALSVSESDDAVGFWVGGGLYLKDVGGVVLGVDFKYTDAEVSLPSGDFAAGGLTWAVTYGFSF